jgi:hypothetical protein
MIPEVLDLRCIRAVTASGNPHGYSLANGAVVVWGSNILSNTYTTEDYARARFPSLVLIDRRQIETAV